MRKKWTKVLASLFTLFLCFSITGCELQEEGGGGKANVSPLVEQWRSDVVFYANKYGISEHVELLLAMIAQESGGDADSYPDIMQCSASAGLPNNAIKNPVASIEQGVKYFASLLATGKEAGVDDDTVLQSYNFGGGYIGYIRDNHGGKHSEEAARAFSNMMRQQTGFSIYGDVLYVQHVKSHMTFGAIGGSGINNYDRLYQEMISYEGVPYVFGGESHAGIDCSALMLKCYQTIGVNLPRTAQEQYDATTRISESEAQPGDMVFFHSTYDAGSYITHVGIYLGNGQMFNASGDRCQFSSIQTGYWQAHIAGFGRV